VTALDTLTGSHPASWEVVPLESVCAVTVGPSRLQKTSRREGGVRVLSSTQIIGGRIVLAGANRIDDETAGKFETHRTLALDVVMTRRGQHRRHALVGVEHAGAVMDGSCLRLRVGDQVLAEYLHHYLAHPNVQEWLESRNHQGTRATMNAEQLRQLPILVPPLPEQQEIVNLFIVVDEKIRTHEQIIATTRALRAHLIKPLLATGLSRVEQSPDVGG
jgi:restriction endonuclease S subunit